MTYIYKVAFVASIYGHFTAFHLPFIRLLQKRGCEVHVYARAEDQDDSKKVLQNLNVVCHDTPIQRHPLHIENWQSLRQLTRSFKKEKFQMVHVHTPVASILGRIAARKAFVPFVVYTAHGFHFYKGAPWYYWLCYYTIERVMARYTDVLITINREDYQQAKRFPVKGRVTYIPGGVGLDVRYYQGTREAKTTVRRELDIESDVFVVTCVAEFIPRKNQEQLIEAVQMMVERGCRIACLLVGEGGTEERLKEKVKRAGIDSHVHFLGSRHDIPNIVADSDVCVLVSRQEGLPRVLMEAMAGGKPVVATDIRGNRDLIRDGENGFLVPLGDAAATAEALMTLYEQPDLRKQMGQANDERVWQYDISRILNEMERVYFPELRGRSYRFPETIA